MKRDRLNRSKPIKTAFPIALSVILLSFVFSACEDDKPEAISVGGTTTVTLHVGTESDEPTITTRADDAYSQYEGIRTLRIIATIDTDGGREIIYNEKVKNGAQNTKEETVTIPDMPIGEHVTFYAIANEESLGMTYTNDVIQGDLESVGNSRKILFKEETEPYKFPKFNDEIAVLGLPMTGKSDATIAEGASLTLPMARSVVKFLLTVENGTGADITLTSAQFGPFSGDRFYLFREVNLDVPDDTEYDVFGYSNQEGVTIPAAGTNVVLAAYIYPTFAFSAGTDNPYTLALTTKANNYGALVFAPGKNSFTRNTQVNITARITTEVGIQIDFRVAGWDSYTVDVPPFE